MPDSLVSPRLSRVFLATALLAGCHADPAGDPADATSDTAVSVDSPGSDTHPPPDSGDAKDASSSSDTSDSATLTAGGHACSSDDECKALPGQFCNFAEPTPVCFGGTCGARTDTAIVTCDHDGICIGGDPSNICLPMCTFQGAAFGVPCFGKNGCQWIGDVHDAAGAVVAYGSCQPNCTGDSDCPSGNTCHADGVCAKSASTFTGALGDACTNGDGKCFCVYDPSSGAGGAGYCSKACRFGETSCGAGFTCDPAVTNAFPALPAKGMFGYCLKSCDVDGDCPSGKNCGLHAGMTQKTCLPYTP